jgi:mRNA interferase RelE/StbE
MSYTIKIKSSAKREIKKLSTSVQVRITKKLEELEINPRPPDVKKLQGYEKTSRVRVGEYRIIAFPDLVKYKTPNIQPLQG